MNTIKKNLFQLIFRQCLISISSSNGSFEFEHFYESVIIELVRKWYFCLQISKKMTSLIFYVSDENKEKMFLMMKERVRSITKQSQLPWFRFFFRLYKKQANSLYSDSEYYLIDSLIIKELQVLERSAFILCSLIQHASINELCTRLICVTDRHDPCTLSSLAHVELYLIFTPL